MKLLSLLYSLPLFAAGPSPLHDYLLKAVAEKQIAGAVVIVEKEGKIVFREAVGLSDIAANRPVRVDDLFMLASSTKPLSATTVLTLVDQGKLRLDDPVSKFYPEFQGPSTVRQLLSHTSGIFGNDGPPDAVKWIRSLDLSLAASAAGIVKLPLSYQPGSKYSYGGASFEVAGGIVEKITGMDYEAYMRQVLLDPLGMKETYFRTKDNVSDRVAVLYAAKNGQLTPTPALADRPGKRGPRPDGFVLVAGGLYSTADDALRFLRMHLNLGVANGHRILSEPLIQEMRKKQTGALPNSYGLGWNIQPGGVIGHGGAYGTDLWFHPQRGIATVVMIQRSSASAPFQSQVKKLILDQW